MDASTSDDDRPVVPTPAEPEPSRAPDAPEADALDQATEPLVPTDQLPGRPDEADEADRLEQAVEVLLDDEDDFR